MRWKRQTFMDRASKEYRNQRACDRLLASVDRYAEQADVDGSDPLEAQDRAQKMKRAAGRGDANAVVEARSTGREKKRKTMAMKAEVC